MGQRHTAQGEDEVGALEEAVVKALVAADEEAEGVSAHLCCLELLGQFHAGAHLSALVQGPERLFFSQLSQCPFGLFAFGQGALQAGGGQLQHMEGDIAGEALGIFREGQGEEAGLIFTEGEEADFQWRNAP